jgi:hypothetical protein
MILSGFVIGLAVASSANTEASTLFSDRKGQGNRVKRRWGGYRTKKGKGG